MTDKKEKKRIAFWLLPTKADHLRLTALIEQFSTRFDTPLFAPHVTLLVVPDKTISEPISHLEQSCRQTKPFTLELCAKPSWGPHYNQALTLSLKTSPELARLVSLLHPQQHLPNNYTPHISLIYGNLSKESGRELIREIDLACTSVCFDRCSAIQVGAKTCSDEDVRTWKVLATKFLSQ